jgi:colicin import membrane protein
MTQGPRAWLSDGGMEPALFRMLGLSALIHVAAIAVVVLVPRELFVPTPPPIIAYTVKAVDPNALGGRLPKGPIQPDQPPSGVADPPLEEAKPEEEPKPEPPKPPEPKPEEAKPEPPKAEEPAVIIPDAKASPEPKKPEEKKPEPSPAARAERKRPTPSAAELAALERNRQIQEAIKRLERGKGKEAAGLGGNEEGKGAALGVGGDGGGGGIVAGLDFLIYKNQVEGVIKRNWTWVGANPNLTVRVAFGIENDGKISEPKVVTPSGDSSYDESVLRAVRISSPLPEPPEKYRDVFRDYVIDFVSGEMGAQG